MLEDLRTAWRRDPALYGIRAAETILYPGLWALWSHRLAHRLHRWRVPFLPRLLSQVARAATGVEIHPGARIGRRLFIDHGYGVVIGETARIGDDVTIYHHVTLGGRGWWCDPKGGDRHPTIGDRVVLGVGATVLGSVRVGADARIGAHCLVLHDVPARARLRVPAPVTDQPVPISDQSAPATDIPAPTTEHPAPDPVPPLVPPRRSLPIRSAGNGKGAAGDLSERRRPGGWHPDGAAAPVRAGAAGSARRQAGGVQSGR